ncbi:MAG: hypothetical protein ACXIUL_12310 [Wenzhouxiangella sp.]
MIQANQGSAPIGLLGAPQSSSGQIDRTIVRHNQHADTAVSIVASGSSGEQRLSLTGSLLHDNPGLTLFRLTGRFRLDLVHVTAVHEGGRPDRY